MKYKPLFWGLILIAIGMLFILGNLGIVHFSWFSFWRLWPVILLFWGITILPVYFEFVLLFCISSKHSFLLAHNLISYSFWASIIASVVPQLPAPMTAIFIVTSCPMMLQASCLELNFQTFQRKGVSSALFKP